MEQVYTYTQTVFNSSVCCTREAKLWNTTGYFLYYWEKKTTAKAIMELPKKRGGKKRCETYNFMDSVCLGAAM